MKFAQAEQWLHAHADQGSYPCGCDFLDVEDIQLPSRLGRGNVAWPPGWTKDEIIYWRAMEEMPGFSLPEFADKATMPNWYGDYLKGNRRQMLREQRRQTWRWLLHLD